MLSLTAISLHSLFFPEDRGQGGGVLILFPINFVWDSSKPVNHDIRCGDRQVQVVSNNGEAVVDEQLNRASISGQNGFEWVALKTKSPMKSPVAGLFSERVVKTCEIGNASFGCNLVENAYHEFKKMKKEMKTMEASLLGAAKKTQVLRQVGHSSEPDWSSSGLCSIKSSTAPAHMEGSGIMLYGIHI
ncbi:hypothetical protein Tco_0073699 [Tanacetum coccineum]